jgi:pyruvate dehydrogenase E2 component (dihydrolipoamide acetyltransferase)
MPQLGETVAEGKITKWFKSAGEQVKPGDNLFEIETDKVSMEVPSITSGVLAEIRVAAGEVAPVGAVVAVIADGTANASAKVPPTAKSVTPPLVASAALPATASAAPVNQETAQSTRSGQIPIKLDPYLEVRTPERNFGPARLPGGGTVTPLARRLAGMHGIDLAHVRASGPRGRIVARDIESALQSLRLPADARAEGPTAAEIKALYAPDSYQEVPLDGMRRTIAARLTRAAQTVPHFYLTADIDIGRLLVMRQEANASAMKGEDGKPVFKLSLNDFIIKAWAAALQRLPAANAVWAGDRILRFKHSDIGVAVAIKDGLITPVIRNAEVKSLSAISLEMQRLAERSRAHRLKPEEYQGGASTISNLGMYGVREFSAIINPPHATILAIGASRRVPVEADDGGVRFASVMAVTLSCDHRVVDGAVGAELLSAFKTIVESPIAMMV